MKFKIRRRAEASAPRPVAPARPARSWRVFLDDTRPPPRDREVPAWTVLRTGAEFRDWARALLPDDDVQIIAWDHHLGGGDADTGEALLREFLASPPVDLTRTRMTFHTGDLLARGRMAALWEGFSRGGGADES